MKMRAYIKSLWKQREIQLFSLIGVVYLIIFNVVPMSGLIMAFKDFRLEQGYMGIFTSEWVGFKYFIEFFNEYNFKTLLGNTVRLSIYKMIFTFPLPILFAILLNEIRSSAIKRAIQTISYMPYFISWVIVAGFVTIFCNTKSGVINDILVKTQLVSKPISFFSRKEWFLPIAIITAVWKEMGWWAIVFLASLTGIDPGLYEAASIDGASRLDKIIHITLPSIMPTITVVLILAIGNIFGGGLGGSNFDQSYLLGNAATRSSSDIIQTYVFRVGLSEGRHAYATAVGLIQSVISVVLIFCSNAIAKKVTGNGLF